MPSNKNFQRRITILDKCFASRNGLYTLDKLIEIVSEKLDDTISRKSIQNDIKYIEELIANDANKNYNLDEFPVFEKGIRDGHKKAFRYSKSEYELGNQLLNKSDQEQLSETLSILSRYRNREDFDWLDELFPRIETAFNLVHEDYDSLISYQTNRDYSGKPLVGKLYNQLVRKKVLEVEYKSFKESKSTIRVIHPYHLKQYNNRWFLFGYQEDDVYTGITNLALDRIITFTETTIEIKEDEVAWGDFFDEMIGVSKSVDAVPIKLKLKFDAKRIDYVITKPIHGASQRMDKSDPDKRTIIIDIIPNNELYQTLLSFGKDVEVLEPDFVKDQLKDHAIKMLDYYKK